MGRLLDRLLEKTQFQSPPPAIPAIPAILNKAAQPRIAESQESQGSRPKIRVWAQLDADGWHGIAVGAGWWQWCGKFRTLHEALQAAERAGD